MNFQVFEVNVFPQDYVSPREQPTLEIDLTDEILSTEQLRVAGVNNENEGKKHMIQEI